MTPLGIEPAIFGLVAHCLNQLLLHVPPLQWPHWESSPPHSGLLVTLLGIQPAAFRPVGEPTGKTTRGIPTSWWTHCEDNPRHSGLSVTPLGIETTTFRLETNWIKMNLCVMFRLKSVIYLAVNSVLRVLFGTSDLSNFFSWWDYSY